MVLQNFAGAASGFFNGIRTPSSIISGSCLAAMFAMPGFSEQEYPNRTPLEKFLIKLYRMLTWSAYTLSLNAIITATIASSKILHAQFDPMAETGYMLLQREFEYEFLSTRLSFSLSLFTFIIVVTIRILLEFNLLSDEDRNNTAKFVILSAIALLAHLISDFQATLYDYSGPGEMAVELVKLIINRAIDEPTMLRVIAILSPMGAIYFGIKAAFSNDWSSSIDDESKKE